MGKRTTPGERAVARLASRGSGGLYRRTMADGGAVYSGPTASRALRSVGARAMTMNRDIFVSESFDENKAEDQALYAHERHHQNEAGGVASDSHGHAEEMAAQSIERMVLHRSEKGDNFASIMADVDNGQILRSSSGDGGSNANGGGGGGGAPPANADGESLTGSQKAYQALRKRGQSHRQIISQFAQQIIDSQGRAAEMQFFNGNG